jgi:lipid A 4'-phosphatase
MSMVPVPNPDPRSGAWSFLCISCAAGLIAAFLFSAFPQIDLAVSRLFYLDDGTFFFASPSAAATIRLLLRILFGLVCTAAVIGFAAIAFFNRRLLNLGLAASAYIALCAAVGPGLVANLGFKDHWGRARPVHITEFGGSKEFTPPMLRTDQCERNCAFISGEASNYFALGFTFAFLATGRRRRQLFLAAIAAGSFAGLIRIGGGGHFLSDVVFAGVFMAFVTRGLAWLILDRLGPHLTEGSDFHQRILGAGEQLARAARRIWDAVRQRLAGRRKAPDG